MRKDRFSPDLIHDAGDLFDPARTGTENKNKMMDHLSQFNGNLNQRQRGALEAALEDEIARRKGRFDPFASDC